MQTTALRSVYSLKSPRIARSRKHVAPLPRGLAAAVRRPLEKRRVVVVRAGVDPVDRALGSAPYLLPLLDGFKYGTYIFTSYPIFERFLSPIFPLYKFYESIPLASLIFFFGLYFGVALLIDILLILPGFLIQVLRVSSEVRVPVYNVTWMYVFCCTMIGIVSCVAGQAARLPLVANASDAQID